MTKLRFRPGTIGDRKALRALYNRERSPVLPPPNNRDLETALRDGRFIIGETEEGEIVACAAMIPFSPADSVTYVGELTGAFVDKRFRGGKPLSLQTLMLGLRVLHHVVLEGEAVNPAATNTIVTVVAKTNEASLANVKKAGFVECESLPDWWEYETSSWHKGSDKDKWQCFLRRRTPFSFLP